MVKLAKGLQACVKAHFSGLASVQEVMIVFTTRLKRTGSVRVTSLYKHNDFILSYSRHCQCAGVGQT